MNRRAARLLTSLYPRHWKKRYGVEFEDLLQCRPGGLRVAANVVWAALYERVFPTPGLKIDQPSRSFGAIIKMPSAFLPVAASLVALALLVGDIAIDGVVHEADEGAVAHLWQLLMAAQMPIIGFFAIKWLPRAPRQSLLVLALQAGAALASMAPVFFLKL